MAIVVIAGGIFQTAIRRCDGTSLKFMSRTAQKHSFLVRLRCTVAIFRVRKWHSFRIRLYVQSQNSHPSFEKKSKLLECLEAALKHLLYKLETSFQTPFKRSLDQLVIPLMLLLPLRLQLENRSIQRHITC